jgi:putative spermidine/putrescine transport system substrate-binding protein/spermidine/putrescine transport system substrate-binding protein
MKISIKAITVILILQVFFMVQAIAIESKPILKIAGWSVYSDPQQAGKTIGYEGFEKQAGVTIEFTPLSSLDDIINVAESDANYDIFIISNEGIRLLYDMGLVLPLNLTHLSNYQDIYHNLQYTHWSQFESKVYAIPLAWGPTGLMYDMDSMEEPVSWNVLWEQRFKQKVSMWDDVSMIWITALTLGYQNVYSLTKTQLEKVQQKLFEFNEQTVAYYIDGEEIKLAEQGRIIAYNSWYNPSERLRSKGKNFRMIIPKEGAVGMFDSFLLSNKSEQAGLVHQFINYQLRPEVQKNMVRNTGLAPANILTLSLLDAAKIKELHLDEPDYFSRMLLWDHMPRKNLYEKVLETVRKDLQQKQAGQ